MTKKFKITLEDKTYEVEVEEIPTSHPESTPPPYIGPKKVLTEPPRKVVTPRFGATSTGSPKPGISKQTTASKPSQTTSTGTGNIVKAPLPGTVLSIKVGEGDQVKQGDTLLVLESMKMENAITAPKDGVVKQTMVEVRSSVQQGNDLISIE